MAKTTDNMPIKICRGDEVVVCLHQSCSESYQKMLAASAVVIFQ